MRRLLLAPALCLVAVAAASAERPSVQPFFARVPGDDEDAAARTAFAAACRARGLGAVETIELAGPRPPGAPGALRTAAALIDQLRFAQAVRELDSAASDAALTGGAGLTNADLADIHLLRAAATQRLERPDEARAW